MIKWKRVALIVMSISSGIKGGQSMPLSMEEASPSSSKKPFPTINRTCSLQALLKEKGLLDELAQKIEAAWIVRRLRHKGIEISPFVWEIIQRPTFENPPPRRRFSFLKPLEEAIQCMEQMCLECKREDMERDSVPSSALPIGKEPAHVWLKVISEKDIPLLYRCTSFPDILLYHECVIVVERHLRCHPITDPSLWKMAWVVEDFEGEKKKVEKTCALLREISDRRGYAIQNIEPWHLPESVPFDLSGEPEKELSTLFFNALIPH